jgi:hypothetical protein
MDGVVMLRSFEEENTTKNMLRRGVAAVLILVATESFAQVWPAKPIRVMVPILPCMVVSSGGMFMPKEVR